MVPSALPRPTEPPRRKSVLFCPDCGHESPVDGDWDLRRKATGIEYRCPACESVLTTRPLPESTPLGRFTATYTDWVHLWTDWYRRLAALPLESRLECPRSR